MRLAFGTELISGDSWKLIFDDLPQSWDPSLYKLKLFLRGPKKLDLASLDGIAPFEIDATPTDTAALAAGTYAWQLVVAANDASERTELARGTVEIKPNIETQGEGYDGRSFVKRTLDAIEAALADAVTHNMSEYSIPGATGGRAIKYMSRAELLELRDEFAWRYSQERIASGQLGPSSNQIRARFA